VFSEVNEVAEKHKADLIVMGSHGADGLQEIFIGSNTERVVRTSDVPVLVIKGDIKEFKPKTFVFASDFEEESLPALKKAKEMAALLNSKLHLVYINTPGDEFLSTADANAKISKLLDDAKIDSSVEIYNDYTVEKGVLNYSDQVSADLIGIPTHGRRGLSHFFMGSIGEDIANHSEAPVITFKI
jgi:nucleotide-binding universal stress UspA family protein